MHDSFWTHAGSVEEMNRILREEFVGLHSQPILERVGWLRDGGEVDSTMAARGSTSLSHSMIWMLWMLGWS